MKKAKEILEKNSIEFEDEFLTTAKWKKLKEKVINAMEEYKNQELNDLKENNETLEEKCQNLTEELRLCKIKMESLEK